MLLWRPRLSIKALCVRFPSFACTGKTPGGRAVREGPFPGSPCPGISPTQMWGVGEAPQWHWCPPSHPNPRGGSLSYGPQGGRKCVAGFPVQATTHFPFGPRWVIRAGTGAGRLWSTTFPLSPAGPDTVHREPCSRGLFRGADSSSSPPPPSGAVGSGRARRSKSL